MKTSTLATIGLSFFGWTAAHAATVTNDVIFGTGNANADFTVTQSNGVEIGLRAKLRLPVPAGIYNWDGVDTYTFLSGAASGGAGWVDGNTPVWNFEWSVNSDFDGSGANLDQYTYQLSLDSDPTAGVNALTFDPITPTASVPFFDHSIGDNTTTELTDSQATDGPSYATLLANNNLAQNSWNYEFFDDLAPLDSFAPVAGSYEISLEVFDSLSNSVGKTTINVVMIPEPATAIGGLLCVAGLGFRRRLR